jgi:hypothetical protein
VVVVLWKGLVWNAGMDGRRRAGRVWPCSKPGLFKRGASTRKRLMLIRYSRHAELDCKWRLLGMGLLWCRQYLEMVQYKVHYKYNVIQSWPMQLERSLWIWYAIGFARRLQFRQLQLDMSG